MSNETNQIVVSDFRRAIKEAKAVQRIDKKDKKFIMNKPIVAQRFVQLYVSGAYTDRQIARILGVSEITVKNTLREPAIQDMIIAYQEEEKKLIDAKLKALTGKATDTMMELLDDDDSSVRLSAAKDVLDRTGHNVKKDSNININVSYEERLHELSNSVDLSFIDTSFMTVEENAEKGAK